MTNMNFGLLLRRWRNVRHVSQLDLSLDAEISTRHLSCVETGRAQPSREMVLRLAEALQVPLRERNALLLAAGYAPLYRQTSLDAPELEATRHAVELLLTQLEPYPVLLLDRYWNALTMNAGAKRFLALFPGCDSGTPHNGVRLVFDPMDCGRSSKIGKSPLHVSSGELVTKLPTIRRTRRRGSSMNCSATRTCRAVGAYPIWMAPIRRY
jgi:transcriptional regulator with XRE-family HTH domain